jgi:hypothetical protein
MTIHSGFQKVSFKITQLGSKLFKVPVGLKPGRTPRRSENLLFLLVAGRGFEPLRWG